MLKNSLKQGGLYRDKLLPDAKKRYVEKINFIRNVDPYEVPKDQWIRDPDALPPITFPDIFTYFVCAVSARVCLFIVWVQMKKSGLSSSSNIKEKNLCKKP